MQGFFRFLRLTSIYTFANSVSCSSKHDFTKLWNTRLKKGVVAHCPIVYGLTGIQRQLCYLFYHQCFVLLSISYPWCVLMTDIIGKCSLMFKFVVNISKNKINKIEVGICKMWLICLFIKKIKPLILQLLSMAGILV